MYSRTQEEHSYMYSRTQEEHSYMYSRTQEEHSYVYVGLVGLCLFNGGSISFNNCNK